MRSKLQKIPEFNLVINITMSPTSLSPCISDRIFKLGKAISFYIKQKQNNTPRPISVVLEPSTVREGNDSIIKNGPAKRNTLS